MENWEQFDLLAEVKGRFESAGFDYVDDSEFEYSEDDHETIDSITIDLTVSFPCGNENRFINIWGIDELETFSEIDFENYTLLGNFAAIANCEQGKIEAILIAPNEGKSFFRKRSLLRRLGVSDKDGNLTTVTLVSKEEEAPVITISSTSKAGKILTQPSESLDISLNISVGAAITYRDALTLLEQVSNSLLFEIDFERAAHIALLRRSASRRRQRMPEVTTELEYPKNDYDKPPMDLYWYARSAESMPLLQYLAFYQVVEYYYPVYFNAELGRRIRSLIKQPTFRVDRDVDIAKIVSALKNRGHSNAGEKEQLKATLKECLSNAEIEEFLEADAERASFFLSKAKGITSYLLNPQNRQIELSMQVADRIYDIRCKIVHTKNDHDDGEFELLLPYSSEAERLGYDIDLVRFVAQKILIVSSKRFE